jgi:5-methylcytosine-specific restriction endonuclease McrA
MKCLVLDSGWLPIDVISIERAFVLIHQNKATPVQGIDTEFQTLRSIRNKYDVPNVIVMTRKSNRPNRKDKAPTNSAIFARDGFMCAYCGVKLPVSKLTIDHIQPKSKGGKDTWENLVSCCSPCNMEKGDKSLAQWGKPLLHRPKKPSFSDTFLRNADPASLDVWRTFVPC